MVLITIIIYMLILLGVGFWANKRISGMTDFLLAGRKLGLVLTAGALAAIMSTADSLLTAGTSHFIKDIYLEILHPGQEIDEKKMLTLSRISTVLIGAIALIIALSVPMIIDALIYSYTMYTAGVFIPVIGGLLWKGATKAGAITGIVGGALIAIVGIIMKIDLVGIPVEVYSAGISLGLFVVVSLVTKGNERKGELC